MAFAGNPKTWVPYINNKDCTQGFCSLYCPQWCYIIFSPPPPPFRFPEDNSTPSFSPLVIAIIGILASAFLLVSYYTIISKYCAKTDSSTTTTGRSREENHGETEEIEGNSNINNNNNNTYEHWEQVANTGLDEALIRSITICKYKRGEGLIEGTDCSVCLSEFEEDEKLRLLPKCSHAFHVVCIDTWLKSHSNCPLCRANIIFIGAIPTTPTTTTHVSVLDVSDEVDNMGMGLGMGNTGEMRRIHIHNAVGPMPKTPLRGFNDTRNVDCRDAILEIRDHDGCQVRNFRRSISMDHSCNRKTSVADVLRMSQEDMDEDFVEDGRGMVCAMGSSSSSSFTKRGETTKEGCGYGYGVKGVSSPCVMSHVVMNRSFSSGTFFAS